LYIDEEHFGLFIIFKMEILKNYESAGSRHEGVIEVQEESVVSLGLSVLFE